MISCLIIDDEQPAIDVLRHYVARVPELDLAGTFTDPVEALRLLNERPVDLLLLDIQMPELSGIDLIKAIGGKCRVILTTAYSEFVSEAYELDVFDYLLKPVSFPRFLKAIQRLQPLENTTVAVQPEGGLPDDYFFVKTESKGKILKINVREIDYIESMNNYVAIHHNGGRTIAFLNMKDLEGRLAPREFMRIHRSYIIALEKIVSVEGNIVHLRHVKEEIPLGETYRAAFLERMKGKIMQ